MLEILIADDHALLRKGLRDLLETHPDWRVCGEARDGRQAVQLAAQLRPDVAVLDLLMPELNGLEASRRIREVSPPTAVLILSGTYDEACAATPGPEGARAFVSKSDAEQRLIPAIESLGPPASPSGRQARTRMQPPLLTRRELEITRLLAAGKTNWSIATILGISTRTVETHRASVMQKLGLESVVELVHFAIRSGMVEP